MKTWLKGGLIGSYVGYFYAPEPFFSLYYIFFDLVSFNGLVLLSVAGFFVGAFIGNQYERKQKNKVDCFWLKGAFIAFLLILVVTFSSEFGYICFMQDAPGIFFRSCSYLIYLSAPYSVWSFFVPEIDYDIVDKLLFDIFILLVGAAIGFWYGRIKKARTDSSQHEKS